MFYFWQENIESQEGQQNAINDLLCEGSHGGSATQGFYHSQVPVVVGNGTCQHEAYRLQSFMPRGFDQFVEAHIIYCDYVHFLQQWYY